MPHLFDLLKNLIYNSNMEKLNKSNYINTKFSMDNLKRQKEEILKNPTTFTGLDKVEIEKDALVKDFYDTPDFFLQENGLSLSLTSYKGRKTCELVVRWSGEKKRHSFLENMPDTFVMKIGKKDSIYKYHEFLCDSISELIPAGVGVDPINIVNSCIKVFSVKKTREIHRFIHISGLKVDFSFSHTEFTTPLNKKKEIVDMLEIKSDTLSKMDEYNALIKKVGFNNPILINIGTSDFVLAKKYLL